MDTGKYNDVVLARRNPDGSLTPLTREGEPWFLVRAQDAFAPGAVYGYAAELRAAAVGLEQAQACDAPGTVAHLKKGADEVENLASRIERWQADNPDAVKIPD